MLAAGSLMNAILAPLLITAAFMIGMPQATGRVVVSVVQPGTPAQIAGFQPGDVVTAIQGQPIRTPNDFKEQIQFRLGQPTTFEVVRNGQPLGTLTLVPRPNPPLGEGAVGVAIQAQTAIVRYPIWPAFVLGVKAAALTFAAIWVGLYETVRGIIAPDFLGPVGIASVTGEVARLGAPSLLQFAAFLSINLAIINLIPFPALDGGRILFVLIEAVRGRRVDPQKEGVVHLIGMVILLTFIALISYRDLMNLPRM
jgi:regulator of sigma E protease